MTEPNTSLAQLVEAFRAKLDASNDDGLAGALSLLMSSLDAAGVCLVEWSPGHEPIVIAVTGLIQDISQQADFRALEPRVLQHASEAFTRHVEGPPDYWLTAIPWRAGGQLVLVTWGDLADSPDLEVVLPNLLALIGKCLSIVQARREPAAPARHLVFPEGYVEGTSPALRELHSRMEPLLQGDLPVLIVGETGVGKEFVARTLHASSKRAKGPFIAINCAAIPSELLEAELFGIVRGTATGVSERLGKFQQADGGSVFLDEIGDMSSELQAKLLRTLQQREVAPVGGGLVPIDVRVIAATNADLQQRIEQGRFRRDLYYRIAGYVLQVPPLRERQGHIPRLVEDFIRLFSREVGKRIAGISVSALRALAAYHWPGNVRELEHEVRRLAYVCPEGQPIDVSMLSEHIRNVTPERTQMTSVAVTTTLHLQSRVEQLERELIAEALRRSKGNRSEAARLLGISRGGLALKMERFGLRDGAPSGDHR